MPLVPTSLFYRQEGYFVGSVSFDVLVSENHKLEAQVTEHPVETGANINDHIRRMPRKGTLVGLVTNHPLKGRAELPSDLRQKLADIGNTTYLGTVAQQYGLASRPTLTASDFASLEAPTNRAEDAWSLFKRLWETGEPVTISTGLERYTDVFVTSVSTDRTSDTGEALRFTVEFQEVRFVTLTDVEITATTNPATGATTTASANTNRQAQTPRSHGRTGGKDVGAFSVNHKYMGGLMAHPMGVSAL